MDQDRNYKLFKLIFSNVVILRKIYYFIKLHRNQIVIFNSRNKLKEFKSLDYVSKLIYKGKEKLEIGDLPENKDGILKEIQLNYSNEITIRNEKVIPNGVKILTLQLTGPTNGIDVNSKLMYLKLDELPKSIHTINKLFNPTGKITIPPNITSISFQNNPFCLIDEINNNNTTKKNDKFIIPKTVKEISFPNSGVDIQVGDIPEGVEKLIINNIKVGKITKSIFPNSIKNLRINCDKDILLTESSPLDILNLLPINLEILDISCSNISLLKNDLSNFNNIKELSISTSMTNSTLLSINSLPPNLTSLTILNFSNTIKCEFIPRNLKNLKLNFRYSHEYIKPYEINSFPNGLRNLEINRIINDENIILPESLTHLRLNEYNYSKDDQIKFISILPKSLTSIILPISFSNLKLPNSIEKVDYLNNGILSSSLESTIDLSERNTFIW